MCEKAYKIKEFRTFLVQTFISESIDFLEGRVYSKVSVNIKNDNFVD